MRGAFSLEKHQESGSQRENTDGKHRQKTHREKTQTENTDRKHRQKTHREKTQTKNTERKHRQKTQTENTQTENGNTQTETQRETQTEVLHNTTKYYTILFHTTQHHTLRLCTTKYYAALHVRAGNRAQDLLLPRLTPYPRGKFSGTTIVIAIAMRGAIVQIQNTNVHTPRPMRGAIPRPENLRFATVSRDRPTESYERVHPAKSKCAFRYSGVPSKMSKCTFRYSGVHGNV